MRQLAEALGVSKTTVSLAIRGDPSIPPVTRDRVRAAAAQLGYHPDPVLSRIARGRWRGVSQSRALTLASLTDSRSKPTRGWETFLQERILAIGYGFDHFDRADYPSGERMSSVMFNRGVRGLVLLPRGSRATEWDIPLDHFSVVACGAGFKPPPVDRVQQDSFSAGMEAYRRAEALGFRRIGFVLLFDSLSDNDILKLGASLSAKALAQTSHARVRPTVSVYRGELDDVKGAKAWLANHRFDLVVGVHAGIYWLLPEDQRRPDRVSFISLVIDPASPEPREIAGFDMGYKEMAHRAVDWLDASLRHGRRGIPDRPTLITVEPRFHLGQSLGTPKRTRARPAQASSQKAPTLKTRSP